MGMFSTLFRRSTIDDEVEKFKNTAGAYLIDVRTPEEYAEGHIRGSINLPLGNIYDISDVVSDMSSPLFVYCRSGARSGRAVAILSQLGYSDVRNIGGIMSYRGEVVR